jgi:hypothetical protein
VIDMLAADAGGGAGAAFAGIGTAVDGILTAANSGSFSVTPDAGSSLISAIKALQAAVENALTKSQMLEREPPLGETPAANVYKPFLATVASDPVQGAIPVFTKLKSDLVNAQAAIEKAMKNYEETEAANTAAQNGIPI